MPTFDSVVNPLHQIQGLGPVIVKVNELVLTQSILTKVFSLEHFAEYLPYDDAPQKIQVFKIGDGGFRRPRASWTRRAVTSTVVVIDKLIRTRPLS